MIDGNKQPLRILTWHIHGNYLYYLTQTPCIFYLPYKESGEEGYYGRTDNFSWGENVINVPADHVKDLDFDVILYQSSRNYLKDQYEILTAAQQELPKIYLEHDPPREVPTDTKHIVDDPEALIVHVTDFNNLMWNNNRTPSTVIEHGVLVDDNVFYTGTLDKGIVVINNIAKRGRRLGLDIFERVRKEIPLDIVGMGATEVGGLGEVKYRELSAFTSQYRFFFNPIRYTSLGLAVCEAMMTGIPIVGLATTEMAVTVKNDFSGYIHTNVDFLIEKMKMLLNDPEKALILSKGAHQTAREKFNIERFRQDWLTTFHSVSRKSAATAMKQTV